MTLFSHQPCFKLQQMIQGRSQTCIMCLRTFIFLTLPPSSMWLSKAVLGSLFPRASSTCGLYWESANTPQIFSPSLKASFSLGVFLFLVLTQFILWTLQVENLQSLGFLLVLNGHIGLLWTSPYMKMEIQTRTFIWSKLNQFLKWTFYAQRELSWVDAQVIFHLIINRD